MKISSSKLLSSHLTVNEKALLRCEMALDWKDRGDYNKAQEVLKPLWSRVGERPHLKGLFPSVAAEVLLCVGIITCWIGSKREIEKAHETAKDLLGESLSFFQSIGDLKKVAIARTELAICYWCEGALDEARIMFTEALQKLTMEGNFRARALLGLATVEWSDSRYDHALQILSENAPLFKKITNHTIRGTYHNQLAIIFRYLAKSEKTQDYLRKAITEFETADIEFKLAKNSTFRASVKNNVGMLLFSLSKFSEAHRYLTEARSISQVLRDKIRTAQIDDTRAQVFIAEKKYKEAVAVSKLAVRVLEKSGHQCLLADALVTQGIALARMKQKDHAQYTFQKAIGVAHQVGALNKAGIAALTLIEELEDLPIESLYAAYDRASEWLEKSQSLELLLRLNTASRKVAGRLRREASLEHGPYEDPIEALLNKPCDLPAEVLKYEGLLIRGALAKANGSLTRAAGLLSMSYQALAYIIESRQKDLVKERSPIRRRSRKDRDIEETKQA